MSHPGQRQPFPNSWNLFPYLLFWAAVVITEWGKPMAWSLCSPNLLRGLPHWCNGYLTVSYRHLLYRQKEKMTFLEIKNLSSESWMWHTSYLPPHQVSELDPKELQCIYSYLLFSAQTKSFYDHRHCNLLCFHIVVFLAHSFMFESLLLYFVNKAHCWHSPSSPAFHSLG